MSKDQVKRPKARSIEVLEQRFFDRGQCTEEEAESIVREVGKRLRDIDPQDTQFCVQAMRFLIKVAKTKGPVSLIPKIARDLIVRNLDSPHYTNASSRIDSALIKFILSSVADMKSRNNLGKEDEKSLRKYVRDCWFSHCVKKREGEKRKKVELDIEKLLVQLEEFDFLSRSFIFSAIPVLYEYVRKQYERVLQDEYSEELVSEQWNKLPSFSHYWPANVLRIDDMPEIREPDLVDDIERIRKLNIAPLLIGVEFEEANKALQVMAYLANML